MSNKISFENLGLSGNLIEALKKKGFEEPTDIQAQVIPILLAQTKNLIGQAQTGTGKTAAFGLPLIDKLKERAGYVQAIILTPTRELANQVSEEINSLKGDKKLSIVPIYGGQSYTEQFRKLKKGIDIVVGTPGRVIDHIKRKSLLLDKITYLILDEADEMMNMGFIDDVEEVLKHAGPDRSMLLFSATMPKPILTLAKKYMPNYELVKVKNQQLTTNLTDQIYFEVHDRDKFEALSRIIDIEDEFYGLVFCRTKVDVDTVANKLIDRGYEAEGLHGDLSQYQRERIMQKFKNKRINILVATDVAARGIDVHSLTHVINYSLPQDPESYVHRIGRTGRAGKQGTAITFVTPSEYRRLVYIKKIAKTEIRKEKLPGIQDVINQKKQRIVNTIQDLIQTFQHQDFYELAGKLMEDNDAVDVIAGVLKYAFEYELDENYYKEINEVSVNRKGATRLFVAIGKNKGMTPKKLAQYIQDETQVDSRRINNIQIFEEFSFVNVSFEDAEVILHVFKNKSKKGHTGRSLVEKAKTKKRR